jgi:hypothetical protein
MVRCGGALGGRGLGRARVQLAVKLPGVGRYDFRAEALRQRYAPGRFA